MIEVDKTGLNFNSLFDKDSFGYSITSMPVDTETKQFSDLNKIEFYGLLFTILTGSAAASFHQNIDNITIRNAVGVYGAIAVSFSFLYPASRVIIEEVSEFIDKAKQ